MLDDYQPLYLWNPCVRKYMILDSSCLSDDYYRDWEQGYAVGLGFHDRDNDYRLVRVSYGADDDGNVGENVTPEAEVFSLRMNQWRKIQNPVFPVLSDYCYGRTVNGSVYWLTTEFPQTDNEEVWIVSFDFNNEVFRQFRLPDDVIRYGLGDTVGLQLMVFEGSLCVCVFPAKVVSVRTRIPSMPCCIWLMRLEDGIVSLTIRFSVVLEEFAEPLNITKSGRLLVRSYSGRSASLRSCDLKSMPSDDLECHNLSVIGFSLSTCVDTSFVESFVMHARGDELLESAE